MADPIKLSYATPVLPKSGTLVIFVGEELEVSPPVKTLIGGTAANAVVKAMAAEQFKGKLKSSFSIPVPHGLDADRLIVVGIGGEKEREATDYVTLGGAVAGKLGTAKAVTVIFLGPSDWRVDGVAAADFGLGIRLRSYTFDKYKTKKTDESGASKSGGAVSVTVATPDFSSARRAAKQTDAVGDGVLMARELVNEPPNVLDPVEFARRADELRKLGVEVTILDEKQLARIGMRALLGVGQGSRKESRVVIMRWNGAKSAKANKAGPLAFIGKGVTFDTGGISIKPAASMEDMKGDMGGAACVVGLMHALASRKAKCNVVGAIGLVENMPDGNAQRPGDIVTSLSGQTIEIINTDAEGRLVLGDVLWYVKEQYKPSFMIDLATLTGAVLVALGQDNAGLFSNNDTLAERIFAAGKVTGETVWRLPLSAAYDKMVDSRFADMKNTGGRFAGSITAAQFLQRFVGDTHWAHLDIAGTAMSSPDSDINKSWGSGWGVRLLDRMVTDYYEE